MRRYDQAIMLTLCLILAASSLGGCKPNTLLPNPAPTTLPTNPPPPAPTAVNLTVEAVVTHPELEVTAPENMGRLQQIGQWGQGNVHGIALSPQGERLAISTSTGIYVYDSKTGEQVDYIDIRVGDKNELEAQMCSTSENLAFSPDGSLLAVADTDIILWDFRTRRVQKVIQNKIQDPASLITHILFSSDGSRIMGVQKQASPYFCNWGWGSLIVYAIETGELIFRRDYDRLEAEGDPPTPFREKDGIASIWYYDRQEQGGNLFLQVDLQTGEVVTDKPTAEAEALRQSIHHTDRMLVLEEQNLAVRTLDGTLICNRPLDHQAEIVFWPETFSADGRVAVLWNSYGSRAGAIYIWDIEQCTVTGPVLIIPEVARAIGISADGRSVLTGSNAGYTFYVFDTQTGQRRFSLAGFDAALSADGQQVYVAEEEGVNAYDVNTGAYQYPLLETELPFGIKLMVSPNDQWLAINDVNKLYRIIHIGAPSSKTLIPEFDQGEPVFSQDGKSLAVTMHESGSFDLRFWDLASGSELTQWRGLVPGHWRYDRCAFNSDFSRLATLDSDGDRQYVHLWKLPQRSLLHVLTQGKSTGDRKITELRFIANDRLLFARANHPDVFLFWDVQTGELLQEVPAEVHETMMGNPVVFSPDGRLLLVLDSDGTIHVWGVK